jgi:class 3 adenylate cyclase
VSVSPSRSRVLTLVFTDLVDSTALKTQRGDAAVGELIARHREIVTRLAGECGGRIVDWAGDGRFLTFETPSTGVDFALRLQGMHFEAAELPKVRVGIHLGEVTDATGPDGRPRVEGLAVDLASRIQSLAAPGQILMSSVVFDSARQRLRVGTEDEKIEWRAHGLYELKGFDDRIRGASGVFRQRWGWRATSENGERLIRYPARRGACTETRRSRAG